VRPWDKVRALLTGTPHNGSSKARQLDSIHKLASLIVPKRVARFETSLVTGIEDDSETYCEVERTSLTCDLGIK
jgi:hypothetical protein